jgi:AraC-like DNA-binding protein
MSQPLLQYREEEPPTDLAGWVESFWFIQTFASAEGQHWVLPEASVNLVFWLPRGWQQPESMIPPILSGPTLKEFRKPATPGEAYLGVRFRAGAGPAFVDCPGSKLTSIIQPLHMVQPDWAQRLTTQLHGTHSEAEALAAVIDGLRERAHNAPPADTLMIEAAAWFRRQEGPITLQQWSSEAGLSERQFRRRFLDAVGLSPKAFMRVVRMQSFVREHMLHPHVNWGQLSYQAGFADQAHLVNEFRSLSGDRPTSFHRHVQRIDHTQILDDSAANGRKMQYPTDREN